MNETIAIVVAHPDDEVLGCGGTAVAHGRKGDAVHILILAEGLTARDDLRDAGLRADDLRAWRKTAENAAAVLGARSVAFGGFPDNRMDGCDRLDVVKCVEGFLSAVAPTRVYTHHGGDLNIDHRRTHEAVITACRPIVGAPTLLFFEVPSSTEWAIGGSFAPFQPNWFQDIGDTLAAKLSALAVYGDELRPWPHPRSSLGIETFARMRGMQVGLRAAEGFMLGRLVSS